jgi:hypothetical protein
MPIEVTWSTASGTRSPLANARILRLAFGTALSLWISQAVGWSISYMAPVLTMFLLALPMPRPKLRFIFVVVMALAVSVYGTFIFLPLLLHQKAAGFLLLSLALFHSFYFTARGGKADRHAGYRRPGTDRRGRHGISRCAACCCPGLDDWRRGGNVRGCAESCVHKRSSAGPVGRVAECSAT